MKPREKTRARVQIATRAVIAALKSFDERNPGQCIPKRKLVPNVVRRAGWLMEDDDDPTYDEEAIAPPDAKFILRHWPDICLLAAEKYRKYIVWEPLIGTRLGTFDEYQAIRNTLADIADGLAKNVESRDRVVVKQGGKSFLIDIQIKQLGAGER